MSIKDDLIAGLEDLEAALDAQTFEYRGATFNYIPGSDSEGMQLALGGFKEELTRSIIVRRNQMPIKTVDSAVATVDIDTLLADSDNLPPHVEKRIRLENIDYRIIEKRSNSSGASWTLTLGSVNG